MHITYLFLLLIPVATYAQKQQFIDSMNVESHKIMYFVHKKFHSNFLRKNLFVIYEDAIDLKQLDYTILTMPLIMNTISMIWISGENYYIEAMDKDLYYSLEIIHEIFKRLYPATSFNGNLIPEKLIDNARNVQQPSKSNVVALPFSHGLDSLCTSLLLRETPQLLMTVRGCPDTPLNTWNKNWHVTHESITNFAYIHGHTTTFVTSNFHEFFNWEVLCDMSPEITNWRMDAIEDLGWIGLSAPILASKGYTQFVLPSNVDWSMPHPGASCPVLADSITFAGVKVTCNAFDICRPEKNVAIARICNENNLEKPFLYVCEKILPKRKNCCMCQKCAITILSFLLIGEDPSSYGFDISIAEFLRTFQYNYFYENLYTAHRACWFKYVQLDARKKLATFEGDLKDFFTWYLTINFDKLTLHNPQIDINYNDFKDLWNGIPENWAEWRQILATTHTQDVLPEYIYHHIWQKYESRNAWRK